MSPTLRLLAFLAVSALTMANVSAESLKVDLVVVRDSCAEPLLPPSRSALDAPAWRRTESGALEVTIWETENDECSVVRESASASLIEGYLSLSHNFECAPVNTGGPVAYCTRFVHTRYIVHGVPLGRYRVSVETATGTKTVSIDG